MYAICFASKLLIKTLCNMKHKSDILKIMPKLIMRMLVTIMTYNKNLKTF